MVKLTKRANLIAKYDKLRKNLLNPVEDVIWYCTKDIDGQTEFRSAVNILFRRACKTPDNRALFEKALQRFYRSKSEAQGYEYIISLNELLSQIINKKY